MINPPRDVEIITNEVRNKHRALSPKPSTLNPTVQLGARELEPDWSLTRFMMSG